MIDLLIEMKCATEDVRAAGRKCLGAKVSTSFSKLPIRIAEEGLAAKHGVDAMDVLTTSVRLRTLGDGDTDAHLIPPPPPNSPLLHHPL
ncbi:MAG: hypothetical protein M1399_02580 [Actinobacteria bacterium]|nr:hypothetical protein [Actinomycetota bacterium]MCL5446323.1 hypothetical protein [Actinomycetota bacterium]